MTISCGIINCHLLRISYTKFIIIYLITPSLPFLDAIEDILAKYRNKPPAETEDLVPRDLMEKKLLEADEEEGFSDESLFINAKRKLRLVLCNSDLRIYNSGSVVSLMEFTAVYFI